jgi:adenylate kinase family enzyme
MSVGGLLRKEISKKSNLGQQVDQAIKNHTLVPDDVVIEIVKK